MSAKKVSTKAVASIAVLSVVYFIFRMLPTFPMIGVSGGAFSLSDVLAPLYGVILGPYMGAVTVIIGTFLAIAAGKPVIFLGLDFLPATVNTLMVGFLARKRRIQPISLNIALFTLFLLHPYTAITVPARIPGLKGEAHLFYPWLHLAALIILISPLSGKAAEWVNKKSTIPLSAAILLLSLIGTMAQHLTGNLLYETVWGMFLGKAPEAFKLLWYTIFWLYPTERAFIIAVTTLIGTPLLRIAGQWLREQLRGEFKAA
ncbi:MAG: hypothetical protein QXO32_06985 [Candidatus Bathyarchaeia archaeon]